MSFVSVKWLSVSLFALGCAVSGASAKPTSAVADRLHANAVASFRQARFSEAYGRFVALADAGNAPSAEMALWMYRNGPTVFGKDWDSSPEQLSDWARSAGKATAVQVVCGDVRTVVPGSARRIAR